METNYKNVSKGDDAEQKKVAPITQGKIHKKSAADRALDSFFIEDFSTVTKQVTSQYILPGIKRIIADTITNTINMMLFGSTATPTRNTTGSTWSWGTPVNYSKISYNNDLRSQRTEIPQYDECKVESYEKAIAVRDQLIEYSDRFGFATIGDLYELVHCEPQSTYNNYGWYNLTARHISIIPDLSDGYYIIKMPRATYIKN
ncbi:MAG: hypothetical protein KBT27_09385 [Prevotellaceae bacterium]|nr:hypothetical protein [Candidatus Faecinaster equi]